MKEKGKRGRGGMGKREVRNEPPATFPLFPSSPLPPSSSGGWTLIELVIVITVLSVLTLGIVPVVKNSVRRQKEQQLREVLRDMREAIDEFRREFLRFQSTIAKVGDLASEGMRAVADFKAAHGQYPSSSATSH